MAITITPEIKERVYEAMMLRRRNFDGTNGQFARMYGLSGAVFTRIHNGEREGVLSPLKWLLLAQEFDVLFDSRKWKTAKTDVFRTIEEEILFCKINSKARIFVDDCGIGKTYSAKYIARTLKNCFYIDCSQAKTKTQLIRLIAKSVGIEFKGRYYDVKTSLKIHLKSMNKPILIIDEAGDLEYQAFLELKEFWNATEGLVGWYMMGADGLRAKIERGISNRTVGYAEIFSRFSEKFTRIVPIDQRERSNFYKKLISDVLEANNCPSEQMNRIISRCLINDNNGGIGGLRRAESLLILS